MLVGDAVRESVLCDRGDAPTDPVVVSTPPVRQREGDWRAEADEHGSGTRAVSEPRTMDQGSGDRCVSHTGFGDESGFECGLAPVRDDLPAAVDAVAATAIDGDVTVAGTSGELTSPTSD